MPITRISTSTRTIALNKSATAGALWSKISPNLIYKPGKDQIVADFLLWHAQLKEAELNKLISYHINSSSTTSTDTILAHHHNYVNLYPYFLEF
jgi:hypothetical protein